MAALVEAIAPQRVNASMDGMEAAGLYAAGDASGAQTARQQLLPRQHAMLSTRQLRQLAFPLCQLPPIPRMTCRKLSTHTVP
jgi:hypothetical protein